MAKKKSKAKKTSKKVRKKDAKKLKAEEKKKRQQQQQQKKKKKKKKSQGKKKLQEHKKAKKKSSKKVAKKKKAGRKKDQRKASKKSPSAEHLLMRSKITDLFELRLIPWMLEEAESRQKSSFLEHLVVLQERIYDLDQYLETHWEIAETQLEQLWQGIDQGLAHLVDDVSLRSELIKQIQRYQAHELELREGKTPLRLQMRHYYYYKSCDVRLLRKLIYRSSHSRLSGTQLSDWTDFDLITEIQDDITDLHEDGALLNGNRFLFSLKEKGKRETDREFRAFIREIESKVRERFKGKQPPEKQHLKLATLDSIKTTRAILRDVLKQVDLGAVDQARIFQHLP